MGGKIKSTAFMQKLICIQLKLWAACQKLRMKSMVKPASSRLYLHSVMVIAFVSLFVVFASTLAKDEVKFTRDFECGPGCSPHKVPPLTFINVIITANIEGNISDFVPAEFQITDPGDGIVSVYNETYNRIAFPSNTGLYEVKSPPLTTPPTDYYFQSEINGIYSEWWKVKVADPPPRFDDKVAFSNVTDMQSGEIVRLNWSYFTSAGTGTCTGSVQLRDQDDGTPSGIVDGTCASGDEFRIVTVELFGNCSTYCSYNANGDHINITDLPEKIENLNVTWYLRACDGNVSVDNNSIDSEAASTFDCGDNLPTKTVTVGTHDPPDWSSPSINVSQPVRTGVSVGHYTAWTAGERNMAAAIFEWNATGSNCDAGFQNASINASMVGSSNSSNFSQSVPGTCGGKTVGWRQYANDTNSHYNSTTLQLYDVDDPPKWNITATGINDTSPVNISVAINHSANWSDDVGLRFAFFEWNGSGTHCNIVSNITVGPLLGTTNISDTELGLNDSCAGNTISFRFWANDTRDQWNATDNKTYNVKFTSNAPSVASVGMSPGIPTTLDDLTCTNGSVTDTDGDSVTLHYNWFLNGTSAILLNIPFDRSSTDISNFNNTVTIGNSTYANKPLFNKTGGKIGGAFVFDTDGDFINVTDNARFNFSANQSFTIEAWVNASVNTVNTGIHIIAGKRLETSGGAADIKEGFDLRITAEANSNVSRFDVEDSAGTNPSVSGTTSLEDNKYHHIAAIRNADNPSDKRLLIYVDGTLEGNASDTTTGSLAASAHLYIGGRYIEGTSDLVLELDGTADEFTIWNRTLTSQEILNHNSSIYDTLADQETADGDTWRCSITPVDSTGTNNTAKLSGNVTVGNLTNFTVALMDGHITTSVPATGQNRTDTNVEFNSSDGNTKNVNGSIIGNSSANQSLTVAAIKINNTGNVPIMIILMLNTTPISGIEVFADLDNNTAGASPVNSTQNNVINKSVPTGVQEEIWVWTNFTNILFANTGSVVDLNISSSNA